MSASGRDPREAEAERLGPGPPVAPSGLRRRSGATTPVNNRCLAPDIQAVGAGAGAGVRSIPAIR